MNHRSTILADGEEEEVAAGRQHGAFTRQTIPVKEMRRKADQRVIISEVVDAEEEEDKEDEEEIERQARQRRLLQITTSLRNHLHASKAPKLHRSSRRRQTMEKQKSASFVPMRSPIFALLLVTTGLVIFVH